MTAGRSRPRVLVLRALGLGDFLTGVPAYRALRRHAPDAEVILAAPAVLAPLARLSGAIDRVLDARPLEPLPAEADGADLAVNLHGRGPQSHRILLACDPVRMIAFGHPDVAESRGAPRWVAGEHEVARWCRLLTESGIEADPSDVLLARPEAPGITPLAGATVLHPGAASGARRWPPDRFAAVARAERAAGRRVVVTGSAVERDLALAVGRAGGIDEDDVLAGRLDAGALAAVIEAASMVVCGDTGVAHLATAFATPSVVLFGPTPPAEWGPPQGSVRNRAVWTGRRGDPHGATPDAGLLDIGAERVLAEIAALRSAIGEDAARPNTPATDGLAADALVGADGGTR